MIIAISNQKGGCGKTTTAINLAASFAALGRRTLLIDLDPQTHASLGLGIWTDCLEASVYNVLTDRSDKKQFLESVIRPFDEHFDVAPGHVLLSTLEQEFVEKDEAVGGLREVLAHVTFPYNVVIIDCPPSLGFLTFNALQAADLIIVPVDLGSFSLIGVAKLLSMIELIRVKMNHTPQVRALATMVDLRSRFAKRMLEQIKDSFKDNVCERYIRTNVACREAQAHGLPLRAYRPEAAASADYDALTQELLALFPAEDLEDVALAPSDGQRPKVRDFILSAPEARDVYLVGDFNGWRIAEESKLWDCGKGRWQKRILLPPGRYRYKFVIDGKWMPDPSNLVAEPNPFGGVDSILDIG